MSAPRILAVAGPTASGKSALALTLAAQLDGEIVCCDSMQIYRGLDIGTAKPTVAERAAIPHHMVDIRDPADLFSMADYVMLATAAIRDITARGRLPVVCGGTGLYLDALLRGTAPEPPAADEALRAELLQLAAERGEKYLHEQLTACDPASAAAIHPHNVRRVARALEIYRVTGVPKSEWDRRSAAAPSPFRATVLGLSFYHRELLYARIDRRVDEMIAAGLAEEVTRLDAAGIFAHSPTAAAAIGYKELLPFVRGECSLAAAVQTLKTATRRYAKRQITWFSAKPYVIPLYADEKDGVSCRKYEEIVKNARILCAENDILL